MTRGETFFMSNEGKKSEQDETRSQREKEAAPTWYRRQLEAQRGSTPVEKERSRSDWSGGRWGGR
jgi:hypothetical protein